jgi:hypothetical protein
VGSLFLRIQVPDGYGEEKDIQECAQMGKRELFNITKEAY